MNGYVAADRPLISLDNYEANTAYFQTAWRPEVNPFTQLCASGGCNIEGDPTTADVAGYEKRAQRNIDFVMLWGYPASAAQRKSYAEFVLELGIRYGHDTPASPVFGLVGDGLFAKKRE
jgi:hypothetical protein